MKNGSPVLVHRRRGKYGLVIAWNHSKYGACVCPWNEGWEGGNAKGHEEPLGGRCVHFYGLYRRFHGKFVCQSSSKCEFKYVSSLYVNYTSKEQFGWMEWVGGEVDGRTDGWMNRWMDGCMDKCMNE